MVVDTRHLEKLDTPDPSSREQLLVEYSEAKKDEKAAEIRLSDAGKNKDERQEARQAKNDAEKRRKDLENLWKQRSRNKNEGYDDDIEVALRKYRVLHEGDKNAGDTSSGERYPNLDGGIYAGVHPETSDTLSKSERLRQLEGQVSETLRKRGITKVLQDLRSAGLSPSSLLLPETRENAIVIVFPKDPEATTLIEWLRAGGERQKKAESILAETAKMLGDLNEKMDPILADFNTFEEEMLTHVTKNTLSRLVSSFQEKPIESSLAAFAVLGAGYMLWTHVIAKNDTLKKVVLGGLGLTGIGIGANYLSGVLSPDGQTLAQRYLFKKDIWDKASFSATTGQFSEGIRNLTDNQNARNALMSMRHVTAETIADALEASLYADPDQRKINPAVFRQASSAARDSMQDEHANYLGCAALAEQVHDYYYPRDKNRTQDEKIRIGIECLRAQGDTELPYLVAQFLLKVKAPDSRNSDGSMAESPKTETETELDKIFTSSGKKVDVEMLGEEEILINGYPFELEKEIRKVNIPMAPMPALEENKKGKTKLKREKGEIVMEEKNITKEITVYHLHDPLLDKRMGNFEFQEGSSANGQSTAEITQYVEKTMETGWVNSDAAGYRNANLKYRDGLWMLENLPKLEDIDMSAITPSIIAVPKRNLAGQPILHFKATNDLGGTVYPNLEDALGAYSVFAAERYLRDAISHLLPENTYLRVDKVESAAGVGTTVNFTHSGDKTGTVIFKNGFPTSITIADSGLLESLYKEKGAAAVQKLKEIPEVKDKWTELYHDLIEEHRRSADWIDPRDLITRKDGFLPEREKSWDLIEEKQKILEKELEDAVILLYTSGKSAEAIEGEVQAKINSTAKKIEALEVKRAGGWGDFGAIEDIYKDAPGLLDGTPEGAQAKALEKFKSGLDEIWRGVDVESSGFRDQFDTYLAFRKGRSVEVFTTQMQSIKHTTPEAYAPLVTHHLALAAREVARLQAIVSRAGSGGAFEWLMDLANIDDANLPVLRDIQASMTESMLVGDVFASQGTRYMNLLNGHFATKEVIQWSNPDIFVDLMEHYMKSVEWGAPSGKTTTEEEAKDYTTYYISKIKEIAPKDSSGPKDWWHGVRHINSAEWKQMVPKMASILSFSAWHAMAPNDRPKGLPIPEEGTKDIQPVVRDKEGEKALHLREEFDTWFKEKASVGEWLRDDRDWGDVHQELAVDRLDSLLSSPEDPFLQEKVVRLQEMILVEKDVLNTYIDSFILAGFQVRLTAPLVILEAQKVLAYKKVVSGEWEAVRVASAALSTFNGEAYRTALKESLD